MDRRRLWTWTAMAAIALAASFGAAQAGDDGKKPDGSGGDAGKADGGKEGGKEAKDCGACGKADCAKCAEKASAEKKSDAAAAAPAFKLKDTNDRSHSLADFKDKDALWVKVVSNGNGARGPIGGGPGGGTSVQVSR